MEIFRGLGLEEQIRANRTGDQKSGEIARARNLSDPDVQFWGKPWADTEALGAATAETCNQDRLEPILRAYAERLGADIRFNTELEGFDQRDDAVMCRVRDLRSGDREVVTASYLVAADGSGGTTREQLGIGRSGPGVLQHWMNLIFETDLTPFLNGRRFTSCFVTDVNGSIVPREPRWLLAVQYQPEKGESPADFDQQRTRDLVPARGGARRRAGRPLRCAELGRRRVPGGSLPRRPRIHPGRRRAHHAADRRLRRQHRHPRRAQPSLETRVRSARQGQSHPPRQF